MSPTVSVIIAAYNPGELLRTTLDSVIGQDRAPDEILVVDDRSTEDLSWVEALPATRLLRTSSNGGPGLARNVGVANSTGDWVAFVDQDDVWEPTKLARQFAQLGQGSVFSHTNFDLIDAAGTVIHPGYGEPGSYRGMLSGRLGILLSSSLVRRDFFAEIGGFNHLLRVQQDLDFFMRAASRAEFSYVDSVEVHYRLHESQGSKDYWRAAREIRSVYGLHEIDCARDEALTKLTQRGIKITKELYSSQALDAARSRLRSEGVSAAIAPLRHMVRLRPRSVFFLAGSQLKRSKPRED